MPTLATRRLPAVAHTENKGHPFQPEGAPFLVWAMKNARFELRLEAGARWAGSGTDQRALMVANEDDSDKSSEGGIQEELHELVQGLREEVTALRDEVTALRRKEAPDGPDALLTREEAAERLCISVRTLDDMEERGEIQAVRIRGRVLYAPETLDAYIRRRAGEGRS